MPPLGSQGDVPAAAGGEGGGESERGGRGGGGGRILNEASISVHHRQTNVTDRNGSHDTSANCALVNSLATVGRRARVAETSQEQP